MHDYWLCTWHFFAPLLSFYFFSAIHCAFLWKIRL